MLPRISKRTTSTTPGAIIGYRRNGAPIRLIAGGSGEGGDPPAPNDPPAPKPNDPPATGEDDLGDAGKRALSAERQARRAAEKAAEAAEAELARIREANQSEQEKALTAARKEAADQVRAELTRERVLDKIEVAAAGKFADVEDARLRLGARADEFIGRDGKIDAAAITKAVDDLLTDKPHLAASTTPPPPAPPSDGRPIENLRPGGAPNQPVATGTGLLRLQQVERKTV